MKMKLISLIRTDEKADEVNISLGEAVIGRGQLLKCADKRISRNHGLINLSEKGAVILTSKHLNPIYYSEQMHPLVEIHSGQSVMLNDGDEFSLLPDSYRFRIAILSDKETEKTQNGCINGESTIDKDTIKEEVHKTESLKIKQEVSSESEKFENAICDSSDQCAVVHKSFRNLPAWMTSQDESKPGTSTAVKKERKRKYNVKNETVNKKAKVTPKKKKNNTNENSDDEDENDQLQSQASRSHQKKPGKVNDDDGKNKNEMDVDRKTCGSSDVANMTKVHELSDEEVEETKNVGEQTASSSEEKKSDDTKQANDEAANPGDQNAAANNARQKCQYGAGCYRRNPQHRTDLSHPGDADYDNDDVPECPYGLLCYRKNIQHRLDYKHTVMPQQQNNPKKKKKNTSTRKNYAEDDEDEEDDYDYDDPFLNDASSDDYQPTDSGSENSTTTSDGDDEEDKRRMLKEAKRFTRKKK